MTMKGEVLCLRNARLAQLVERKTLNLVVVGSSPTVGKAPLLTSAKKKILLKEDVYISLFFFFCAHCLRLFCFGDSAIFCKEKKTAKRRCVYFALFFFSARAACGYSALEIAQ